MRFGTKQSEWRMMDAKHLTEDSTAPPLRRIHRFQGYSDSGASTAGGSEWQASSSFSSAPALHDVPSARILLYSYGAEQDHAMLSRQLFGLCLQHREFAVPTNLTDVATGSASAWRSIDREINELAKLRDDWDGMDGIAPPAQVISGLRELVAKLKHGGAPPPTASYVVGDGEAGLRWKKPYGFASVSFLADGTFLSYARGGSLKSPYSFTSAWRAKPEINSFIQALAEI